MKCLTWNVEWAEPGSARGTEIQQVIRELDPDVVCCTEVTKDLLPQGHRIEASADYGYPHSGERRKVILWSKTPWDHIDCLGHPRLPPGRFVTGITEGVRFVGVCIPWKDAHVRTGRRDRVPWEEHLQYLQNLKEVLEKYNEACEPICVFGDFNQRIPRSRQPESVFNALEQTFSGYNMATAGSKDDENNPLIDHIATTQKLEVSNTQIIPKTTNQGLTLSDHIGVVASLKINAELQTPY